jgi:hypothetical protein
VTTPSLPSSDIVTLLSSEDQQPDSPPLSSSGANADP